eukprot:COSAG02_NODE_11271_length_1756_cov_12.625226_1_plen_115_part_00
MRYTNWERPGLLVCTTLASAMPSHASTIRDIEASASEWLSLTDAALEEAVGRSTNVLVATIRSGDLSAARIPEACEMEGAISYPPPETLLGVQEEFKNCIEKVRLNRGRHKPSV